MSIIIQPDDETTKQCTEKTDGKNNVVIEHILRSINDINAGCVCGRLTYESRSGVKNG